MNPIVFLAVLLLFISGSQAGLALAGGAETGTVISPGTNSRDRMVSSQRLTPTRQERRGFQKKKGAGSIGVELDEGERYPSLTVKILNRKKTWPGNIIFGDSRRKCIVEVDLDGKVVWQCSMPSSSHLGDVELLPSGNLLVLCGNEGIYELSRERKVVWSYRNEKVDHDADRLKNGNTLIASSGAEKASEFPYDDPQAFEVNPRGEIVWVWHAKKEYANGDYANIRSKDGGDWTHVNSVQRLDDGLTLISVRNWNLLVAVDTNGLTRWKTGDENRLGRNRREASPNCPHTAVQLDNGNIMISEPVKGRVIEWNPAKAAVVWAFPDGNWDGPHLFVRAAHRLPNGNTFIIDSNGQFLEVTKGGEIVWHVQLSDYAPAADPSLPPTARGNKTPCYNADRRGLSFFGGR